MADTGDRGPAPKAAPDNHSEQSSNLLSKLLASASVEKLGESMTGVGALQIAKGEVKSHEVYIATQAQDSSFLFARVMQEGKPDQILVARSDSESSVVGSPGQKDAGVELLTKSFITDKGGTQELALNQSSAANQGGFVNVDSLLDAKGNLISKEALECHKGLRADIIECNGKITDADGKLIADFHDRTESPPESLTDSKNVREYRNEQDQLIATMKTTFHYDEGNQIGLTKIEVETPTKVSGVPAEASPYAQIPNELRKAPTDAHQYSLPNGHGPTSLEAKPYESNKVGELPSGARPYYSQPSDAAGSPPVTYEQRHQSFAPHSTPEERGKARAEQTQRWIDRNSQWKTDGG